ncbi:hypothetical protein JW698_02030 [Candidatus Wolfebacteria bacterium]|nr:hypothetical protein [Candidatus Wolfebacteria bacterium]
MKKRFFFWVKKSQNSNKAFCLYCGKNFIVNKKEVFTKKEIAQGGKNKYCPFCKKGVVWIPAPLSHPELVSFDPKIELKI